MFKQLDLDGSGELDHCEFCAAGISMRKTMLLIRGAKFAAYSLLVWVMPLRDAYFMMKWEHTVDFSDFCVRKALVDTLGLI